MRLRDILTAISALWLSAYADDISLNFGNDTLEAAYRYDLSYALSYDNDGSYALFGSVLHTSDDTVFKVGFEGNGSPQGAESFHIALGMEGAFADDFIALPLFMQLSYTLPLDAPWPVTSLQLRGEYAPSVLSFVDAEGYREFRIQADIQPIEHFSLYGGYRYITLSYETYDKRIDHRYYAGIRFSY